MNQDASDENSPSDQSSESESPLHAKNRRPRPEDWESPVAGHDAKRSAIRTEGILSGVRGGSYTEGASGIAYKAWCRVAGAEIAAVEGGRKNFCARDMIEGDIAVRIVKGTREIAGFLVRSEDDDVFAEARLLDYALVYGKRVSIRRMPR